MFVFRGLGWLAAAISFLIRVLGGAVVKSELDTHRWAIVVAAVAFALGFYFYNGAGRVLVDKFNGKRIDARPSGSHSFHTFLYWAPIVTGFALCSLIAK